MNKRMFFVRACWDDEAKIFYAESDIEGLHIEAKTIDEFEAIMMDVAVDLVIANHFRAEDMADRPLRELVPAILWQRPENGTACA
jgi:hypothetical protein